MKIKDVEISEIKRSKRKTMSLKINSSAEVIVYAPVFLSNYQIYKTLLPKYDWIKKHQNDVLAKQIASHNYEDGDIFYFLGDKFKLKLENDSYIRLYEENKLIKINADCNIPYVIKEFYKDMSKHYVLKKAHEVSERFDKYPRQYKISSAEKRLGSCSIDGIINLSYTLLMYPPEIIEYVIIHEIAHLKEHNHSKRFWNYVEEMMPDYKKHIKYIKENPFLYKL